MSAVPIDGESAEEEVGVVVEDDAAAQPEHRIVVPERPPTDPDAWIDVVERIMRGRVDARRLEIVPRFGVTYQYLNDNDLTIPEPKEIAARMAAFGQTVARLIGPQPRIFEFNKLLNMLVTCNDRWHTTDVIAKRIEQFIDQNKSRWNGFS